MKHISYSLWTAAFLLFSSCATTKIHDSAQQARPSFEMHEIESMVDVEKWIAPGVLVIFDLDNTLFESKDTIAHANWFHDMLKKHPDEEKKILRMAWDAINVADYEPVEEITPNLIRSWQDRGIAVMALTSRDLVIQEATLRQVRQVGVDFSKTSPVRKRESKYLHQGILFASSNYPKGYALQKYLAESHFQPTRIILIDDLKKNLKSVGEAMGAVGLYYPLVDNKRHLEWDEANAEQLWLEGN